MSLGLYRTFKSNCVPYYANGNGRDRYILYDNAGFFHNFQKSLSPSNIYKTGTFFSTKMTQQNKTQSIKAPNFHYHANGSGRDRYILANGGGLYSDSKPLISFKLSDFLRKHETNYNVPPIKRGRISLSKAEIKYNKSLRNKEKGIIRRLYENEKKKFLKKNKTDLFALEKIENNEDKAINEVLKEKCLTSRCEKNNKNNNRISAYKLKDLNNKIKNGIELEKNEMSHCFTPRTSRDFYSDIKRLKYFTDLKNKKIQAIKPPYFHISNENSIEKKKSKL